MGVKDERVCAERREGWFVISICEEGSEKSVSGEE